MPEMGRKMEQYESRGTSKPLWILVDKFGGASYLRTETWQGSISPSRELTKPRFADSMVADS